MTWLVWRLHRTQVLTSLAVVATIAILWMVILWETSCAASPCTAPVRDALNGIYPSYSMGMLALAFVLGVIAGAPLFAREYEERTHAFVITQSGRHRRWVALKLLIAAAPVTVALAGLGVLSAIGNRAADMRFDLFLEPAYVGHGPLLAGTFLLAFALSVLIGVIGRRTLPAMVVALFVFAPIALAVALLIRPAVLPPDRITMDITDAHRVPGESLPYPTIPDDACQDGLGVIDDTGTSWTVHVTCDEPSCHPQITATYVDVFRPADFWMLQAFDIAAYTAIATAALALAANRLSRRQL